MATVVTVLLCHQAPLGRQQAELGGGRHLIYGAVEDDMCLAAFGVCCGIMADAAMVCEFIQMAVYRIPRRGRGDRG